MKPRFQADNDLRNSIRLGVQRREPSIDFQSARAAGLEGLPDSSVLQLCAEQGRMLVTSDQNTMPLHFREFLSAGNRSPGVLIAPQGTQVAAVIESILLLWIASNEEEWQDRIVWLPL
ncbi:MAG: DUF5615 family PIN-like protein [Bryobacteraceae bacterium]